MTTWKILLDEILQGDEITHCTLTDSEMAVDSDHVYEGVKPFRAWSKEYVYFSTEYDCQLEVGRVRRNPCTEPCDHI